MAEVLAALDESKVVESVLLGGSRAHGLHTELSDWDFYLEGDPEELMDQIPRLIASLRPLAAFWEPLSEQAGYMTVLDGPVKVDLFPAGGRRPIQPPWVPNRGNLGAIDGHFWDWMLWLGSKALRGERELVADELVKMHRFLLGPLGGAGAPAGLGAAVTVYRRLRDQAADAFRVAYDPELGRQVSEALERHGLLSR